MRGKSKRLYSMARQLSRAMSSEYISLVVIIKDQAQLPNRYYHNTPLEMLTWPMSCLFTSLVAWIFPLDLTSSTTDGGGGKLGRGTLTPQSTEDKTENVSISATYNEPNADTQLWFSTNSKSLNFLLFPSFVHKSTIHIPSTIQHISLEQLSERK